MIEERQVVVMSEIFKKKKIVTYVIAVCMILLLAGGIWYHVRRVNELTEKVNELTAAEKMTGAAARAEEEEMGAAAPGAGEVELAAKEPGQTSDDILQKQQYEEDESDTAELQGYIGEEAAKEAALAHAGVSEQDIAFYKVGMDRDWGVMLYEIDFIYDGYEYEYDIDAETGEIVKNKKEADDDHSYYRHDKETGHNGMHGGKAGNAQMSGGGAAQSVAAGITPDKAKEIALNHAGKTADAVFFKKAKLDYDDDIQVYEIEFVSGNTEYEYKINAETGDIWDYEWDHD